MLLCRKHNILCTFSFVLCLGWTMYRKISCESPSLLLTSRVQPSLLHICPPLSLPFALTLSLPGPWPVVPVLMSSRRTAWACHWLSHCVVWSPRKPWISSSDRGGHTCVHSTITHTHSHTHTQSNTHDLKLFVPPHFLRPTSIPFCVLQTRRICVSVSVRHRVFTHATRC